MGKIENSNSNIQCCVPQCKSRSTNEISLFRFPKDESQRKKWTDAIKIEKGRTQLMQVCSRHFVKNDYIITDVGGSKVKRLKRSAVPSQNLPWQFPNKHVSPTLAKARMERLKNRSQLKTSDSPVKSESPAKKSEDAKKPEGSKKSEGDKKPVGDTKSDSSSEKFEDTEPKTEEMSDEYDDDEKETLNTFVDVKDEIKDENVENAEEAVEENTGDHTDANKDEKTMTRAPTRLRQRQGVLKCEHCGRKCLTPQALQTHQQIAHKNARNSLSNPKKETNKPIPVALISVKSPENLNVPKFNKPLEKSLNTKEVEKVLQDDSDFMGSDRASDSSETSVKETVERKAQRKVEFECPICMRRFAVFFMANRHIQKHHGGPHNGNKTLLLPKPTRIEICTICNISVESNIHVCAGPLKLAMGFVCSGCEQEYKTLTLFDMHKSSRHNEGVESMFFPTLDEFEVWKQRMETQTQAKYTILDQNDTKKIHRCTHRTVLGTGNNSIQRMCPSSIIVQEFTKGFQVHYYPHHYDHAYEKYNLGKAFKNYSISSLMNRTASKLPDSDDDDQNETDLYLQFKKITDVLVNEAARINVNGLKKLMRNALDMIAIVNSYVEDDDDDVITSSVIKLDPDKDDLQDQVKKALQSLKRPSEIIEEVPVKRRKSVFQNTENTWKTKEVERNVKEVEKRNVKEVEKRNVKEVEKRNVTKEVEKRNITKEVEKRNVTKEVRYTTNIKDEETENSFEKKESLKLNQSPSFIDSFQDFVGKTFVKPVEKKKRQSDGKKASAVKTKMGQFKPKSPPKASLSPKSPKNPKISPRKSTVKEIEYEVKEQDNDCNILILKI